ncbi:CaiB/BaiF CoA-transferase family protein [Frankia sp. Cr1]|uniref:CaiB/BaiF CoA-transferase family protein n=1 Tax=Frankia sp. Cr1 TaxID=3073931 RepID=UPI002AD34F76|nr:CoA transferase [Frankia sp. Cr1]
MSAPLEGVRVVDLTSGISGAYATKLLADGGADVVKVELPAGDWLRGWRVGDKPVPAGADGALFQFLAASKSSVVLDVGAIAQAPDNPLGHALLSGADLVFADADADPVALRARYPHAVVVAISSWGLGSSWADRPATDAVFQAIAGAPMTRGNPAHPPVIEGGDLAEWAAGLLAGIGGLVARWKSLTSGTGDLVDVSKLEAAVLTFCMYPVTFASIAGGPMRSKRAAELNGVIDEWAATKTTAEILDLADALRVPAAEVGRGDTLPEIDHFVARHAYTTNPGGFVQPDVSYTLGGGAQRRPFAPAPAPGRDTERLRAEPVRNPAVAGVTPGEDALPFAGLRIADFTMNWAGPIIGNVCAMFGPNTNKRDLTLDLGSETGRDLARRLVAHCDVVIENYSPRVMDNWGLTYDALREVRDDVIFLRCPAYGLSGPWRDRGGYAQTMEMASGLAWLTGWPGAPPEIPNGPMDPLAGGHSTFALLLALEHRRRTGEGMLLESPMIFGALNVAAEQVIEHSAYGTLLTRQGNRSPHAAPQGAYRTADPLPTGELDRWVLISVASDEQWRALTELLGRPEWSQAPELSSAAGRHAAHDQIDERLAAWAATQASTELVDRLVAAGVPAAVVARQDESPGLTPIRERGFFETVLHPVTGGQLLQGYPARLASGPPVYNRTSAPLLGQDNADILKGLLGVTDQEYAALEAAEVIGTMPSTAGHSRGMR